MKSKIKTILCLNGNLPEASFFKEHSSKIIIASDGAFNHLQNIEVKAKYIIGDLDSISQCSPNQSGLIEYNDQNYTDFEKCLLVMHQKSLFPAIICGLFGKELDHAINNLNCFMKYSNKNSMVFYDRDGNSPPKWGLSLTSATTTIFTTPGETISILPHPKATVSTKGLKWELNKAKLCLNKESSPRNMATGTSVTIKVLSGKILLIKDNFCIL
ncbi:MAG: hypothetical protein DGJ47_000093 [Rickettsiaceae bacterium]